MPRRKVLRWFRDKPVTGEENDVEQTGLGVNGNRLERPPSRREGEEHREVRMHKGCATKMHYVGRLQVCGVVLSPRLVKTSFPRSSVFSVGFPVSTSSLSIC